MITHRRVQISQQKKRSRVEAAAHRSLFLSKLQINKVVIHERYQAAVNNVFRYQEQAVRGEPLSPQCGLTGSQRGRSGGSSSADGGGSNYLIFNFSY